MAIVIHWRVQAPGSGTVSRQVLWDLPRKLPKHKVAWEQASRQRSSIVSAVSLAVSSLVENVWSSCQCYLLVPVLTSLCDGL